MNQVEIAQKTISVLNERGHCHSAWEWEGKVCLIGAVKVALGGYPRSLDDYSAAAPLIADMASDRYVKKRIIDTPGTLTRLFKYNDVSSKRSVIALLNRSIKRLS